MALYTLLIIREEKEKEEKKNRAHARTHKQTTRCCEIYAKYCNSFVWGQESRLLYQ